MNIRPAEQSDLDALVELNRDVQELHVGFRPSVFKLIGENENQTKIEKMRDRER